jgi:hypothetical protein
MKWSSALRSYNNIMLVMYHVTCEGVLAMLSIIAVLSQIVYWFQINRFKCVCV